MEPLTLAWHLKKKKETGLAIALALVDVCTLHVLLLCTRRQGVKGMARLSSRRNKWSQGYRKPLLYGVVSLTILFLVARRNVEDKGLPAVRANQSGANVKSPVTEVAEEPFSAKKHQVLIWTEGYDSLTKSYTDGA